MARHYSPLAFETAHPLPAPAGKASPVTAPAAEKPALWRRVYEALARAQMRRAEREIGRYIAMHGGTLTDSVEREIQDRFLPDR
jgi:hypothetical protein